MIVGAKPIDSAVACCGHAQAERPDNDAPKEIAEHRRQTDAADDCNPQR
jgi:hypothetical protein